MVLAKYYNFTVDDFLKLHNDFYNSSSVYTSKTFKSSLIRIENIYNKKLSDLKLSFLENIKDLFNKLLEYYSENTILSTLSSLSKLTNIIDYNLNTQLEIKQEITKLKKKIDNDNTQQVINSRIDQYVEFKEIKNKVNKNINNYLNDDKSFTDFRRFLILCLFVLNIPTRIQNYINMLVVKDDTDLNNNYNYIVYNPSSITFIFNKYKTSKYYGQKILKVNNNNLILLINKWFTNYNTSKRFFLIDESNFEISQKLFTKDLKTITKKLFKNEGFSVDVLRSSFITELYNSNPNFRTKCFIADLMGNSHLTSEINYRKVNTDINRDFMGLPIS
jgi:hypothetical protein